MTILHDSPVTLKAKRPASPCKCEPHEIPTTLDVQLDRLDQFLIGGLDIANSVKLQIRQRETIMAVSILGINLNHILELDDRLLELSFLESSD
jgi:hypothetical protein